MVLIYTPDFDSTLLWRWFEKEISNICTIICIEDPELLPKYKSFYYNGRQLI